MNKLTNARSAQKGYASRKLPRFYFLKVVISLKSPTSENKIKTKNKIKKEGKKLCLKLSVLT